MVNHKRAKNNLLSRNRGMVIDFEQFQTYVWSEQIVDNATICAEINRLKKSLKEDFVVNVRGMGYMVG
jgi:DNA-binding winged helix-turn-helix (wHTH) protein